MGILNVLSDIVTFNFRIDIAIDLKSVLPAVIVKIEEAAAPGDILVVDAESR